MLTVIIFTYNHENFITECLESILHQKTTYPYKVHIWDDCSTDATSEICRSYARQFPNKITLTIQNKNTFCGPYEEMQSLSAIRQIQSKYFSIIDGDDCWCDEHKIQIALDFLEKNSGYIGFAHDTLYVEHESGKQLSYVHDCLGITHIQNPVNFGVDAPFFLTSSRIFRTQDYASKGILPIDYLVYYYHLSKGPIFYYDKIMAIYNVGKNSTFASQSSKLISALNIMFAYKLFLLFGLKENDFCSNMILKYGKPFGIGSKYFNRLKFFQRIFGIKLGWEAFMILNFVPKFGTDCLNINFIYANRKKVKNIADKRAKEFSQRCSQLKNIIDELDSYISQLENIEKEKTSLSINNPDAVKLFQNLALSAIRSKNYDYLLKSLSKFPAFSDFLILALNSRCEVPKLKNKILKYRSRLKSIYYSLIAIFVLFLAWITAL